MSYSSDHYFETFGPFQVPLDDRGRACRPSADWWREINSEADCDLSASIGCYLFSLGRSQLRPWYVGKTVAQGGSAAEAFTDHKLNHYNWALRPKRNVRRRGPPQLFLFPLITKPFDDDWRFAKGASHSPYIEWLERTLIGMAYARNPDIANSRDTTFLKTVHVRGLIGSKSLGRRPDSVRLARRVLLGREAITPPLQTPLEEHPPEPIEAAPLE
ncbi:hypothetical protein GGQ97_000331 [Sphingomonas kaistensis]|uniref:Uncharacterized protein n=1 Tax=Sphingomonas kaistensis TaxID=298708 RepID=A0A7X6BF91_9SPHN|nr:hypothetical protein [Sphingomonas kaistensis]NJC04538.1 hypothetical protein [Sphingomonas kaistensis]